MERDAPLDMHAHVCPHCRHLYKLFADVWRVLLDPFLSGAQGATASDAAEGFAYLMHRTKELLESGPQDTACAMRLMWYNIKQTKKYTRYKHSTLKIFERHLAGELEASRQRSVAVASVADRKIRRR